MKDQIFDADKVADIARQISAKDKELTSYREALRVAREAVNKAECERANLASALTRAIDGQLDLSVLKQKPVQSYEATT